MAFQVSPGVQVREIDLTNVVPAVSTSIGATVIQSVWGPVEEIVTVTSEKDLVDKFGTPTNSTAAYFLNAAAFLKYGNNLKVVRAVSSTGALNATSGTGGSAGTGLLIKNKDVYDNQYADGSASVGVWAAKYPGGAGNSLKVSMCPANGTAFTGWAYASLFDGAPGTSAFASSVGGSNDELHVVVIDEDGNVTGAAGTVLEKFAFVSQASDAKKFDGSTNYYKEVISGSSSYVWLMDHLAAFTNAGTSAVGKTFATGTTVDTVSLAGGADGTALDVGDIDSGFQLFNDSETIDVNLLIGAPSLETGTDWADAITQANNLIAIAENRKDLVAFVSPPIAATVGNSAPKTEVLTFADGLTSSSYGFTDSTALKVYDKYNDVYRWIPAAGHMAGLCANTDEVADAWFSPGGYNRGQLLGITRVAFNPKKAERDDLYKKRVNPIVSFPGEGTILFGDKTLQAKPSAFDRINVRRLFIVLEKAVATAAKYQLFELNDEFTRAMFRNMTEPFLREIKGRRGITDFKVVCDSTNNTGEVIDSNQFVADIYIKPARSINFITLNFIATRTGVDFSEIGG
jgi:phage tail sheath protein FI